MDGVPDALALEASGGVGVVAGEIHPRGLQLLELSAGEGWQVQPVAAAAAAFSDGLEVVVEGGERGPRSGSEHGLPDALVETVGEGLLCGCRVRYDSDQLLRGESSINNLLGRQQLAGRVHPRQRLGGG